MWLEPKFKSIICYPPYASHCAENCGNNPQVLSSRTDKTAEEAAFQCKGTVGHGGEQGVLL